MSPSSLPTAKSVLIVATLATVVWVSAGSLTPPAGPVTPTMKNLSDVEPRTAIRNDFDSLTPVSIPFPGSYYLAEDILALPGQHGISIDASQVTLDLNGFTVYGNLEVGSLNGINIAFDRDNITIKDGTVRDFGQNGIYGPLSEGCIVENVRAVNNSEDGIVLSQYSRIKDCMLLRNGENGLFVARSTVITGCVSATNGALSAGSGIRVASDAAVVSHCVADSNTGQGVFVFNGNLVTASVARSNTGFGIAGNPPVLFHGAVSTGNGGGTFNGTQIDCLGAP